ncbi:GNAT family N-acetyltransferase [Lachnoclostridium phytofermentans]|uniref:GCN5-related N-acetyltransferase n=1 Tax=Lachnoclostridium phytofermentans (strain ATCC 700394 / DSM 18823 / ISDg) TaxID=357809 RepID=A9KRQ6_LACP7|nr:GNAT family N-acetyltransferase [Lachnoclostridium phytofermentans]ABX43550.1 GCN5-related N-acetyltransferase [Lachnoclostridium phytofermentans ISDg]
MDPSDIRFEQLKERDYPIAREILQQDIDSGEDLLRELSNEPESLTATFLGEKLVALAQIEKTIPQSYLVVYVAPNFRGQGIGSAIDKYAENILQESGTASIMSAIHANYDSSLSFARKHGYDHYYSSAFMVRTGEPFPLEMLHVRPYTDEDYLASQALYAKAFHEMRVRVGSFPNSVIAMPNENNRKSWKEDSKNRFVYMEDGEIAAHGHLHGNELGSISVRTDLQGRGIGKKFIMYLCNELYQRGYETIELWCVVGNYARNIYDSFGFKEKYIVEFQHKTLHK